LAADASARAACAATCGASPRREREREKEEGRRDKQAGTEGGGRAAANEVCLKGKRREGRGREGEIPLHLSEGAVEAVRRRRAARRLRRRLRGQVLHCAL
jgi:hypothetical protein